jgi:D-alanyl-D-alanine carboxypeptidase/D-alanyl-D-alanine-endopeptidase (penicillin-binding protein 4)
LNPGWEEGDEVWATPTNALWMDRGIAGGVHSPTPAIDAAAHFARLLGDHGLAVALNTTTATAAPAQAVTLAEAWSPSLAVIVQECLRTLDNDVAEVLFRQIGRANGGDGSIKASPTALTATLREMGLWAPGMAAIDGSGLSYSNLVTAQVIAQTMALALTDPAYRALAVGVPTAGGDGTLGMPWRYNDPEENVGRGAVRAKTGTLTGVHTLGGFVQTTSGAVVAFAFMCNDAASDPAAQNWLDHATALVAGS